MMIVIMVSIVIYLDDDDRPHDDNCTALGWCWWSSLSWPHNIRIMMLIMFASYMHWQHTMWQILQQTDEQADPRSRINMHYLATAHVGAHPRPSNTREWCELEFCFQLKFDPSCERNCSDEELQPCPVITFTSITLCLAATFPPLCFLLSLTKFLLHFYLK